MFQEGKICINYVFLIDSLVHQGVDFKFEYLCENSTKYRIVPKCILWDHKKLLKNKSEIYWNLINFHLILLDLLRLFWALTTWHLLITLPTSPLFPPYLPSREPEFRDQGKIKHCRYCIGKMYHPAHHSIATSLLTKHGSRIQGPR